ncbi:MAG: hypothetical protein R2695_00125 [Acidimicrobiales bacterium]
MPKTAGSSFRLTLESVYGDDLAAVYDGAGVDGRAYRAVHGHFSPSQFWSAGRHARLVTWLRDPVERIRSYYDFWRVTAPHGNPNHDEFLRREMSLVEFAGWHPIRTEFTSTYVPGLRPDDFFFIGLTERYDDDLARLAELLGWNVVLPARENVTPGERSTVDAATRREIEQLHAAEVAWYRGVTPAPPM